MITHVCMCCARWKFVLDRPAGVKELSWVTLLRCVPPPPKTPFFLSSISLAGLALNIPFIHWWSVQQRSGECRWRCVMEEEWLLLLSTIRDLKSANQSVDWWRGDQQTHTRTYIHYTSLRKRILPVRSLHSCKGWCCYCCWFCERLRNSLRAIDLFEL